MNWSFFLRQSYHTFHLNIRMRAIIKIWHLRVNRRCLFKNRFGSYNIWGLTSWCFIFLLQTRNELIHEFSRLRVSMLNLIFENFVILIWRDHFQKSWILYVVIHVVDESFLNMDHSQRHLNFRNASFYQIEFILSFFFERHLIHLKFTQERLQPLLELAPSANWHDHYKINVLDQLPHFFSAQLSSGSAFSGVLHDFKDIFNILMLPGLIFILFLLLLSFLAIEDHGCNFVIEVLFDVFGISKIDCVNFLLEIIGFPLLCD